MARKVGEYFFGRHLSFWGIWQYDSVTEKTCTANHIKDVFNYEDAVREVYKLNGWGEPKKIVRRF